MDLVVRNLRLERAGRVLVESLSIELHGGERWALLGPNGAGKTTLLLALAGLFEGQGGSVSCNGDLIAEMPAASRAARIGWQGEAPSTDFGMTVRERVELAGRSHHLGTSLYSKHELDRLIDRPLSDLSQGERQRVELAALEIREVAIWLLDEPTAHLDILHQIRLMKHLDQASLDGRLVVAAVHDLAQAVAFATHAVLLDGQGGAWAGRADQMLEPARLQDIFGADIRAFGESPGAIDALVPDYRGVIESSSADV